jgi:hypothetical protein
MMLKMRKALINQALSFSGKVCNYVWFFLWVHACIQETVHTVKL